MEGIFYFFLKQNKWYTPIYRCSKAERESEDKRLRVRTHVKTLAGIIWDSGAASIRDCHVLVELGITKPNSKNHSGDGKWPVLTRWRPAIWTDKPQLQPDLVQLHQKVLGYRGAVFLHHGAVMTSITIIFSTSYHPWYEVEKIVTLLLISCFILLLTGVHVRCTHLLNTVLWRKLSVPVWTSLIFQRRKSSVPWKRLCISGSSWGPELK